PSTARETSVFLATFRNTPAWRAFLRRSVNWATVRPAYSAATSECAVPATSASSATTSFFWFRFRAIALPLESRDWGLVLGTGVPPAPDTCFMHFRLRLLPLAGHGGIAPSMPGTPCGAPLAAVS